MSITIRNDKEPVHYFHYALDCVIIGKDFIFFKIGHTPVFILTDHLRILVL